MSKLNCLLFVPAKEKFLIKSLTLLPDAIIFDLEDSISETDKHLALETLFRFLENNKKPENIEWFVRVNKKSSFKEISRLVNFRIDGFMIPKVESQNDFKNICDLLENTKTIALVETPMGVINIEEIVKLEYVNAIAFGAEDYSAIMNIQKSDITLNYVRGRLLTYSKAYKKQIFDTPCFELNNMEKAKTEIEMSFNMGFDGKLAIHPKQINLINAVYNNYDLKKLSKIINLFYDTNSGVIKYEGKVYEKMHIKKFEDILKNTKKEEN